VRGIRFADKTFDLVLYVMMLGWLVT
jgi:hypothetical protein